MTVKYLRGFYEVYVFNKYLVTSTYANRLIIARKSGPKCCNYGDAETILFLKTQILDIPNVEKNVNTSKKRRKIESQQAFKTGNKLGSQKSIFSIFNL